ncbi:MAG: DUF364 domain-containing protein [Methanocalculaceae archaeon]|jgi:uncharacterized protein (DUF4213/DUF364 family)|nr:DUF364 domain-containing protein [Methanocalculaceae archaeon]
MWKIYDAIISGIPEEYTVEDLLLGGYTTYVKSGSGCGVAGTIPGDSRPEILRREIGMPLHELAEAVKSWNYVESSIGLAAMNAYYNSPEIAAEHGVELSPNRTTEDRKNDPFIMSQSRIKNKKVCVIGHFPRLEQLFAPVCDLSIIEILPGPDDYPEPASDYLVPEADFVFITCASIVYKTLSRYLKLAKNAENVVIVGSSTPLAPAFFDFGVDDISSFVIRDCDHAKRIAQGLDMDRIHSTGQKVSWKRQT